MSDALNVLRSEWKKVKRERCVSVSLGSCSLSCREYAERHPPGRALCKCSTAFQCEVSNCVVFGAVNCIAWLAKQFLPVLTKVTSPGLGY